MIKTLLTLLFLFSFPFLFSGHAQKTPKRELRGAWISTHLGLDWPVPSHTIARKKDSLISILDHHKATGMNTIYFQVRNQCDALYPSSIEPWSSVLTGTQGRDPGWDPLQFVIDECRKRGLEVHAWINPYRAVATASQLPSFSPNHIAKRKPEWLLNNGSVIILNPGLPEVRNYILSVITDIVQRYDVDGIHFDDYFYQGGVIRDTGTYNADPRGLSHADWRRDNVNLLIQETNQTIKSIKPWVKFGVSPSGIYLSKTATQDGSATAAGAHQHYKDAFADSKKWLQQGWVDYLAPQLYWFIGQGGSDYRVLVPWWNSIVTNDRHIYIGQAIYKVGVPAQGPSWANPSQIPNQMRMNRDAAYPHVYGEIAFRTLFLRTNPLNVRDSIQRNIYRKPALPPVMPWLDNTPPLAPSSLTATRQADGSYVLNWVKPPAAADEMNKVRQFVIYRSESPVINTEDTANILAITSTDVDTYTDMTALPITTYYYTVTSIDRLYNESTPSNVTDYEPPTISCPEDQVLTLNASCSAIVPDYTSMATVSDDVSSPSQIAITQSPAAGTSINGTGSTIVTLTATDASGKSSTCTFNVLTVDNEAPSITCPENMVVNPTSLAGATVNYTEPIGTDNCSGAVTTRITGPAPGATFPIGTTLVSYEVTDASGHTSTCSFTVTVRNPYCDNNKNNRKVYVCHNGNTQCISVNALQTFLDKGAKLGLCEWYEENSTRNVVKNSSAGLSEKMAQKFVLTASPNPVSHVARIQYEIPANARVSIKIYDLSGKEVGNVFSGNRLAGQYSIDYNASGLSQGVYYCRMMVTAGGQEFNRIQKLIKVK